MLLIDTLAEEHISKAIRDGELDNLPGQGRPLRLDDDSAVSAELRAAYRILKNAGCLPPELELRREIRQVEALLQQVDIDDAVGSKTRRRLCLLRARLAMQGRELNLLVEEGIYREKLLRSLDRYGADQGRNDLGPEPA